MIWSRQSPIRPLCNSLAPDNLASKIFVRLINMFSKGYSFENDESRCIVGLS